MHPNPTRKRDILAHTCRCGCDVSGVEQKPLETYDCVEIPRFEPDVTRVTLHGGVCPGCAKRFKAAPPEGLEPGSPFGANLRALVIYLRDHLALPLGKLRTLLRDSYGLEISEGALVNILKASRDAFARQVSRFKAELMCGTVISSDETGMRVGKKNRWLWVFHHGLTAVFVGNQSRAKSVVDDFLGDWRPDYWLSDRYAGQMGWATKDHQYCLAHLCRDVQYAIDKGDDILGPKLLELLQDACAIGRRRDRLEDTTLRAYEAKLDRRLDALLALGPTAPDGQRLLKVFKAIRANLFVFITHRELDATNNGAERSIRPATLYRKITNGFRAEWAAERYADVRGVVETGRRRTLSALEAIRLTLSGLPLPIPAWPPGRGLYAEAAPPGVR